MAPAITSGASVDRVKVPGPALVLVAFLAILLLVVLACRRTDTAAPVVRASWTLTPGVVNPEVTQATIHETICVRGWTKTIRPPVDYTNRLKLEQMRAYRLTGSASGYQEDHLISLELGGNPTDPRNLWPEPYPRASEVDATENDLNHRICAGSLSLVDAQRKISEVKHDHG
jgi:hypothetical protein